MKIILVNRFFFPDESATSLMLTDLVREFRELPLECVVITGASGYTSSSSKAGSSLAGVRVAQLPSLPIGNDSLWGRAANFILFYISLLLTGLWLVRRNDIVICLTDPPFSNVIVRAIAGLKRAVAVNWIQDIYPEAAIRLGFGDENALLWGTLKRLRNKAWRHASANVCIGERMQRVVESNGVPSERITIIPNWADDCDLLPLEPSRNPLRKEWGFAERDFIVGYSGNLGRAHDASTMLEAARLFSEDDDGEFRFLFIGGGAKHKLIEEQRSKDPRLGDMIVTRGYRPRSQLRASLTVPDVHWLSLIPELEGLIVPSKFYGAIAVGRPVIFIGDTDGEIARQLSRANCGQSFAPGDAEGVATYLKHLQSNPTLRAELGENARHFCENELTRRARMGEWLSLIKELTAPQHQSIKMR